MKKEYFSPEFELVKFQFEENNASSIYLKAICAKLKKPRYQI